MNVFLIALLCFFISVHAEEKPPQQVVHIGPYISCSLPKSFKERQVRPIDSLIKIFKDKDIEITFELGRYNGNPRFPENAINKTENDVKVKGTKGRALQYTEKDTSTHFYILVIERIDDQNHFTCRVSYYDERSITLVKQIIQSIHYKKAIPIKLVDQMNKKILTFEIKEKEIADDFLSLSINTRGCEQDEYELHITRSIMESFPLQMNAYLIKNSHDECPKQRVNKHITFDLTPLKKFLRKNKQNLKKIIVNINSIGGKNERIIYTFD